MLGKSTQPTISGHSQDLGLQAYVVCNYVLGGLGSYVITVVVISAVTNNTSYIDNR